VFSRSSLVSIIALARSGALDRAWQLFQDAGFENAQNDPRALSVCGRLKKDQAILAAGLDRKRLYRESAASYARAAELSNTTYPRINAATLSLLAGDPENAARLAAQVLAHSEGAGDDLETPYYRAATRAEALLLIGRDHEAEKELASAIDLAPRAYEDHASTLRQFALILSEQSASKAWLDPFRPPRSLHFAGHMMLSPDDRESVAQIRDILSDERVGFGYGALAAGADILIAEALLERSAELHVILPVEQDRFRAVSVGDRNAAWSRRFDAVLDAASSVEIVDQTAERPSTASLQLSAEIAMGRCTMNANMLTSESVQLLLLDGEGAPGSAGSSEWSGRQWQSSGRRQRVLHLPRSDVPRLASIAGETSSEKLVAMLRLDVSAVNPNSTLPQALASLANHLASEGEAVHVPRWIDDVLLLSFETSVTALKAARQIAKVFGGTADLRIAGHYGIGNLARNPFDGSLIVGGTVSATLAHVLRSTPLGGLHVTEHFVAALYAGAANSLPRIQYVGELPDDPSDGMRLYAVAV
jgi:hypothetical protein